MSDFKHDLEVVRDCVSLGHVRIAADLDAILSSGFWSDRE